MIKNIVVYLLICMGCGYGIDPPVEPDCPHILTQYDGVFMIEIVSDLPTVTICGSGNCRTVKASAYDCQVLTPPMEFEVIAEQTCTYKI